jgi:hypothetical protein
MNLELAVSVLVAAFSLKIIELTTQFMTSQKVLVQIMSSGC